MPPKIRAENVIKIFGEAPDREALPMLQGGASKEEILEETGHVVGVNDASFSVDEGELFVVMGLSGSGKSTLIRCINRLIEPTSGRILVDQQDIVEADGQSLQDIRRTKLGMVFQHFALFPHMTVVENAAYGLKVRGIGVEERRQRGLEVLDMVGLREWADHYPENLSGGMQQRVGLARALATDPDVLLMDEPFSALDPLIRRDMQDELIELQKEVQKTIVFITHDLNEALRIGDRVAIMNEGLIVQIGKPAEIVTQPATEYVRAFTEDVDAGRVLTAETIMRSPRFLRLGQDSVQTAQARMAESQDNAMYVVDDDQSPVGVLTRDGVEKAVQDGVEDLESVVRRDFPSTGRMDDFATVCGKCTGGLPVAVLGDNGRLDGVVDPMDALRFMAEGRESLGNGEVEMSSAQA